MLQRLSEAEVRARLSALEGWALSGREITRTFHLKDFTASLLLVNGVGLLAEAAGHHPDITIQWNKVTFSLTTHDAGGLTEKDFALAAQIDALPTIT
jgi:4a-hydroxytetrahydrobiopterin dehydratase